MAERPNGLFIFAIIFFLSLGVRLWFLARLQSDPVYQLPISDPKEFNFWALQLANGNWVWNTVQNHTPLYAYFLAFIYTTFGFYINAAVVVQSILGSLSAYLMFILTRRVANTLTAWICAGFAALYWFFIYTQVFLFSESLGMFLNIVLICQLTFTRNSIRKFFLSGILFGLSLACRPDILLFGLFILWWMKDQIGDGRRLLKHFGIFMIGVLIILMPILIHNHELSGEWILRKQIGANIYMGNSPELSGSNIFVEKGQLWMQFISMPYRELNPGRDLSETEMNNFFINKTLADIKEHPGQWLKLMGGKVFTILTGREFLRSEDVYFRDRYVLGTPIAPFSTHIIFLFALIGFFLSWRERKKFRLIYALLLSMLVAFFFPAKTRYLVPVIPFIMLFSALAVAELYQAIKAYDRPKMTKICSSVLILGFVSFINPLGLHEPDMSETFYSVASNLQYQKNYPLAEKYFHQALALNDKNYSAWHDLGLLYLSVGDYNQALASFDKARKKDNFYVDWEQYYYKQTLTMINQEQTPNLPDSFAKLESEDNPDVRKYLELFHFP